MTSETLPSPDKNHTPRKSGIPARAPFSPGSQWVKLHQRPFLQIVDKRMYGGTKLTLRVLRVYLVLICHMDRRNYVNKCQKDLASIIGMTPQAFSSALKRLEEMEFIFRIGGRDKSRKIMLSAFYVGIGSEDELRQVGGEFRRRIDKGNKPKSTEHTNTKISQDVNDGIKQRDFASTPNL